MQKAIVAGTSASAVDWIQLYGSVLPDSTLTLFWQCRNAAHLDRVRRVSQIHRD
jgi:hypothetical protein